MSSSQAIKLVVMVVVSYITTSGSFKLSTFGPLALTVCPFRCVSLSEVAMMDGGAQRSAASWENGTLAPVDRLRSDRADSPTPGLVEGTEPGEAGPHPALSIKGY